MSLNVNTHGMYVLKYKGLPYQVGQITHAVSWFTDIARNSFYAGYLNKEERLKALKNKRDQVIKMVEENYEFWKKQVELQSA